MLASRFAGGSLLGAIAMCSGLGISIAACGSKDSSPSTGDPNAANVDGVDGEEDASTPPHEPGTEKDGGPHVEEDGGADGGPPTEPLPPVPNGALAPANMQWKLYFEDAFTNFDPHLWYRYHSTYGDDIGTIDYLRPENVTTANGILTLHTRRETYRDREFTSGFVSTGKRGTVADPAPDRDTFFPRAGFYEARLRSPQRMGLTQAFWLRHRKGASVADASIMENLHIQSPGATHQVLNLDGAKNSYKIMPVVENPADPPAWHTYGLAIVPEGKNVRFTFYIDGAVTGEYVATDAPFWRDHPEPLLWDISLNTHTGGTYAGDPDGKVDGRLPAVERCAIGYTQKGYPDACPVAAANGYKITPWRDQEAAFDIDYVRVWSLAPQ